MKTHKLITYNLFEGAHQNYSQLLEFIKNENADILCLQEVNGWQDNNFARLKDFATQSGLAGYVFGDSNTEYKLATLSRFVVKSQQIHTEGFWHSVVEAQITTGNGGLTVFNLHLNPQWEGPRKEEAKRLLSMIDVTTPIILVGDFNSLSRRDNYSSSLLGELQARGITKFGRDELEFSVTDMLESAGLIDVYAQLEKMTATVPSAFNTDKNHEVPLRLDYAFASPAAFDMIESAKVIKNTQTNAISDHYPLELTLSSKT